jgi:hypothetical protein
MNPQFAALIESLDSKYESLMLMAPVTVDTAPKNTPKGGVYLFSSGGRHLYVGRTKRSIKDRLKDHVSTADDCPFAWHLARKTTNNKDASYKFEGSRKHLLSQSSFRNMYENAKQNIRKMEVRYVGESHPIKQALLEIYVAVAADAEHNDFDTH